MRFGFSGPRLFGIRPWIGLSPSELGLTNKQTSNHKEAAARTSASSFLYVIRGDHNMVKIGVTTNPTARIASLRTGSPFPLSFSFIGCTPGPGYDIEKEAHAYLAPHRCEGEWFDVSPEAAAAALLGAAAKLGHPMTVGSEENATLALKLSATGYLPKRPGWGFSSLIKFILWCFLYDMSAVIPIAIILPEGKDTPFSLFIAIAISALILAYFTARPKKIAI